jgi:hypothetical protein
MELGLGFRDEKKLKKKNIGIPAWVERERERKRNSLKCNCKGGGGGHTNS